ncbi:AAEL012263-PA, partial [Aedes aegypti]
HCSSTFRSKALLARHISQLHPEKKRFKCSHCDAAYNLQKNFSIHQIVHKPGNPPFKCPQCGVAFRRHSTLVGHIERHYVNEDHICAICDEQFQTLDELKAHVYEGHEEGLRKRDCNLCEDKIFAKRSLLERHFLIHTKQKPFVCDICGKAFNQKSTLKTHTLVHSKIQEFVCLLCGLKFSQKVNLRVHMLRVHPKRTRIIYKCSSCGVNFPEMEQLNQHIKEHEKDVPHPHRSTSDIIQPIVASRSKEHLQGPSEQRRYSCEICPAAFKKSSHLKQHIKSHYGLKGNRCGICNKTFTTSHTLKVHCNSHSQNSHLHYKCDQCSASFSLQSSLRRHQKHHDNPDRSYSCPYCKRVFKWFQNCKTHMKNNHSEVTDQQDPIAFFSHKSTSNTEQLEITEQNEPELAEEMIIDVSNLPSNVSILDISNLTNCIVRIDDQLYELPVQIGTEFPLHEETDLTEMITKNATGGTVQSEGEILKLNNSEDSLFQYMEEVRQEDEVETTAVSEEKTDHVSQKLKPKERKIPNTTEQDLFEEVIEDGKKKYGCKGCRKVFKKPVDLRRHIRTHTGERPFRCDKCAKSFTLKAVLGAHLKTHELQREMIPCPEKDCGSRFSSKSSLELHRRIHTGDRPFQCGVCRLTFRTSGHAQAHMTSHARLAKRREQNSFEFLCQT